MLRRVRATTPPLCPLFHRRDDSGEQDLWPEGKHLSQMNIREKAAYASPTPRMNLIVELRTRPRRKRFVFSRMAKRIIAAIPTKPSHRSRWRSQSTRGWFRSVPNSSQELTPHSGKWCRVSFISRPWGKFSQKPVKYPMLKALRLIFGFQPSCSLPQLTSKLY